MQREIGMMAQFELGMPGAWDPALIESTAEEIREKALEPNAEGRANGQEIAVLVRRLPPSIFGLVDTVDGVSQILLHPTRDLAFRELTCDHELAHAAMRRMKLRFTHADVWRLALALSMPVAMVAANPNPGDLAAAAGVPWWAADLRIQYLKECRLIAA